MLAATDWVLVCGGFLSAGQYMSSSDIDFYIDTDPASGKEMVIVSDTVHQKQHTDFLARHISKWTGENMLVVVHSMVHMYAAHQVSQAAAELLHGLDWAALQRHHMLKIAFSRGDGQFLW